MLSIICSSNNKEILNNYLLKSLGKQSYKDYELIIIDTLNNNYDCSIAAFNDGIAKSKGDLLMFVHHDVEFIDKDSLKNIMDEINKLDDFGIVGVAGTIYERNHIVSNITQGDKHEYVTDDKIDSPREVFTLDEVLFVIKKSVINEIPFNINNNTWHLYAVEYSLLMHDNGKGVYVIPANIHHASPGLSLNDSYFEYLPNILKKYRKKYKSINTTVGCWYTNKLLFKLQMLKRKK